MKSEEIAKLIIDDLDIIEEFDDSLFVKIDKEYYLDYLNQHKIEQKLERV